MQYSYPDCPQQVSIKSGIGGGSWTPWHSLPVQLYGYLKIVRIKGLVGGKIADLQENEIW